VSDLLKEWDNEVKPGWKCPRILPESLDNEHVRLRNNFYTSIDE
jgi:hypothetical protein